MDPSLLTRRLSEARDRMAWNNPAFSEAYDSLIPDLKARGAGANALRSGDRIPEFALADAQGLFRTSALLLAKGPLVLTFIRGGWCPYCRAELAVLAECAGAIAEAGGHIVAISGETGGHGGAALARLGAHFPVLSDADFGLSLSFGLLFRLPGELVRMLRDIGHLLDEIYGNASGFLPIPATYVVAQDGRIVAHHVDVDFRTRMEPAAILAALGALRLAS